jgi:transposase
MLKTIPSESIVYVDETGIANKEIPSRAWNYSGVRAPGPTRGGSYQRVSIAGAIKNGKMISALILDGAFNSDAFLAFVTNCLLPNTKLGDHIVMDNVNFHKVNSVRNAIEKAGCHLIFQPKYSPDLNPIEHHWAPLKETIRYKNQKFLHEKISIFQKATEVLAERLAM